MVGKLVLLIVGLKRVNVGVPSLIPRKSDLDMILRLLRGAGSAAAAK
jgi:hypothetical protein